MKQTLYDKTTEKIHEYLEKIPYFGSSLAKLYYWKPMMFNFMLVGASGTVLSWILYEGVFRPVMAPVFGGTFLGMVIVTVIVFLWNFTWDKRWSLKIDSQLQSMKRPELLELQQKVAAALSHKFDRKGERAE